ncbi:hypothetical protein ACH5RR_039377 [Cinchona calisaya]|uniref:Uncharacterized protein n=1 Tax=Cinchona calisaya TaxID=153742 RepID=A0ABD2Y3H4_9GENT
MTDGQGNPPNFDVLFAKCYQKKDKTWNGQRAKSVYNEYRNLQAISMEQIDSSTIDESSQPSKNDTNMWVETAGRVKFGRVLGMGPLAREYTFLTVPVLCLHLLHHLLLLARPSLHNSRNSLIKCRTRIQKTLGAFMQLQGKGLDSNQADSLSGPSINHGPTGPSTT